MQHFTKFCASGIWKVSAGKCVSDPLGIRWSSWNQRIHFQCGFFTQQVWCLGAPWLPSLYLALHLLGPLYVALTSHNMVISGQSLFVCSGWLPRESSCQHQFKAAPRIGTASSPLYAPGRSHLQDCTGAVGRNRCYLLIGWWPGQLGFESDLTHYLLRLTFVFSDMHLINEHLQLLT